MTVPSEGQTPRIGILVFDEVEEFDFVGPLEAFGMAKHCGRNCQTLVIADERKIIPCRHGLVVIPDYTFADCPNLLIVPGGRLGARSHAQQNPAILEFVRKQRGLVASVCTGALILAADGILEAISATTHHSSLDLLRSTPILMWKKASGSSSGNRVASSAGVSAGIDLAFALTAHICNEALVQQTATIWTGRVRLEEQLRIKAADV
jgi:transcriptional regulator GlxA family with amidase domain